MAPGPEPAVRPDEIASRSGSPPPDLLRMLAELKWATPGVTWDELAQRVGRSRRQVVRWRRTEAWEIVFREVGAEHVDRLLPAAVNALIKAWSKGNPSGALDVLRSYGYLRPERLDVSHSVDASELQRIIAEVIEDPAQRRRLAERVLALPG